MLGTLVVESDQATPMQSRVCLRPVKLKLDSFMDPSLWSVTGGKAVAPLQLQLLPVTPVSPIQHNSTSSPPKDTIAGSPHSGATTTAGAVWTPLHMCTARFHTLPDTPPADSSAALQTHFKHVACVKEGQKEKHK